MVCACEYLNLPSFGLANRWGLAVKRQTKSPLAGVSFHEIALELFEEMESQFSSTSRFAALLFGRNFSVAIPILLLQFFAISALRRCHFAALLLGNFSANSFGSAAGVLFGFRVAIFLSGARLLQILCAVAIAVGIQQRCV